MRTALVLLAVVLLAIVSAAILGVGVAMSVSGVGGDSSAIRPTPMPSPRPTPPKPQPQPTPRPKPWLKSSGSPVGLAGQESIVNGRALDGETLSADFPPEEWFANIGSKVDGSGMCTHSSVEQISRYLGMEWMRGFRDRCAEKEAGGGYPQKMERQLAEYAKEKGIELPRFVNFEGKDPEQLIEALDAQGIPFAHTYGWSPRYNQKIYHMTWSAKWGGRYGVVVDNNEIGGLIPSEGKIFEWMTKEELVRRMKYADGSAWVFAWLSVPPPPPCPKIEE